MANRRKSLPPVSPKVDPQMRPLLDAFKEIVETGEGIRGNPLDRKLTLRDLIDSGIARLGRGGAGGGGGGGLIPGDNTPPPNLATPPAPTGFVVDGGLGFIFLSWDNPRLAYGNHGYTEIWRHTADNLANAALYAQANGGMFGDLDTLFGTTYYYWIRFISSDGVEGPFNSSNGTMGTESEDPQKVLERIQNSITESELYDDLNARINLIDGPPELAGSVAKRVQDEAEARATAIEAEAEARGTAIATAYTDLEEYADSESAAAIKTDQLVAAFGGNAAESLTFAVAEVDSELSVTTQFNSLGAKFQSETAFAPYLHWDFGDSVEGFTATRCTLNHQTGKAIMVGDANTDPLLLKVLSSSEQFRGALYDKVRVRLRRTAGAGEWEGGLYYSTTSHGHSGSYNKVIDDPPPGFTSGEWVIAEWDMSQLTNGGTDWVDNDILNIRLDFTDGANTTVEVDWVAIGSRSGGEGKHTIDAKANIVYVDQAIADEEEARASQFSQLSAEIDSFAGLKNGDFETGDDTGWDVAGGSPGVQDVGTGAHRGSHVMVVNNGTGGPNSFSNFRPIGPDEKLLVEAWAKPSPASAPDSNQSLRLRFYDASNAQLQAITLEEADRTNSNWQHLRGTAIAPANCASFRIDLGEGTGSGQWWWDDVDYARIPKDTDIGEVPATIAASVTEVNRVIADASGSSAESLVQLSSQHGDNSAAIQVQKESIDGLSASYSVKIDNNGAVSGFGLSSETVNGNENSYFLVNADTIGFISTAESYPITLYDENGYSGVGTGELGLSFDINVGYPTNVSAGEKISISNCDQDVNGIYDITGFASGITFTVDKRADSPDGPFTASIYVNGLYRLTGLSRSGTVATATTDGAHGFSVGQEIDISRADQSEWNGKWEVASVPDSTTFTFTVPSSLSSNPTASIKAAMTTIPFAIEDGRVAIDAAFIVNLVVTDADIDSLSVGKITGLEGEVLDISANSLFVEDLQGDVNSTVEATATGGLALPGGSASSIRFREAVTLNIPSQTRPRIPLLFSKAIHSVSSSGTYVTKYKVLESTIAGSRTDMDAPDTFSSSSFQWLQILSTSSAQPDPVGWDAVSADSEIGWSTNSVWHYGRVISKNYTISAASGGNYQHQWVINFDWIISRGEFQSSIGGSHRVRNGTERVYQDVVGEGQSTITMGANDESEVNSYVLSLARTALSQQYVMAVAGGGDLEDLLFTALLVR